MKQYKVRCVLCGDYLDPENPFEGGYAPNPFTFRDAWMHSFCFENAYQEIAAKAASKPEYLNRQDEYQQRFS
jgi:hypothetical protein